MTPRCTNIFCAWRRQKQSSRRTAASPQREKRKTTGIGDLPFLPRASSVRVRWERLPESHGGSDCALRRRRCDGALQRGIVSSGRPRGTDQADAHEERLSDEVAEAIARHGADDVMEPSSSGLSPLGSLAKSPPQTLMKNGYSTNGLTSNVL